MVLCKYFLEGTCKYGSSCRNEHTRHGTTYKTAFVSSRETQDRTSQDSSISTIRTDMKDAPIWPFSCYGLPGLDNGVTILPGDISFDEVRWEFKQHIQHAALLQDMQRHSQLMMNRRAFLSEHPDQYMNMIHQPQQQMNMNSQQCMNISPYVQQSFPLSGQLGSFTTQEQQAFHASSFIPGQIPERPPEH